MGSKESSQTTENKPPEWATPLFQQSATEATNLYNSGSGGNTYTGNAVSPLSGTTMSGVNQLAQAGANTNTAATRPLFQGIGSAAVSNPYEGSLGTLAAGINPQNTAAGNVSSGDFSRLLNSFGAPSSAQSNLSQMANGSYLKSGNPYFNDALKGQLDDTAAQVQSQFSGAGRYGSGANTGVLTDSLGNIRSGALRDQFNADSANMLAANGQIDAARQGMAGNQLAAAAGAAGVNTGNADRSLQSQTGNADRALAGQTLQGNLLSNAGNMYSTGVGQAQNAATSMAGLDQQNFTNRLTGANATLQAGNILDDQSQRQLSDQIANFYAQDNQDWTRLGMLQSAAAGSAGNYGTQVATARQPTDIGSLMGGFGALLGK